MTKHWIKFTSKSLLALSAGVIIVGAALYKWGGFTPINVVELEKQELSENKSDFGYEIKFPICWSTSAADADEGGLKNNEIMNLMYEGPEKCDGLNRTSSVGIMVEASSDPAGVKIDAEKVISDEEKRISQKSSLPHWDFVKRLTVGGSPAIVVAAYNDPKSGNQKVRWRVDVFCPKVRVTITSLDNQSPKRATFDYFRDQNFSLPEPEKTILESFKCTEPIFKLKGELAFATEIPSVFLESTANGFKFIADSIKEPLVKFNPTRQNESEFMEQTSQKIAEVTSGSLKGAELYRVNFSWDSRGACYPAIFCSGKGIHRYLKYGKQMVFLEKASVYNPAKHSIELRDHFKGQGLEFVKDEAFKVPGIFLEKEILFNDDPRKKLSLIGETESLDLKNYSSFVDHAVAGPIFKINSAIVFDIRSAEPQAIEKFGTLSSSVYVIKNADQTFAIYGFAPDVYRDNKISDAIPYRFSHFKGGKCDEKRPVDLMDVLADQSLSEKDLKLAARTENGDPLYVPPEQMLKSLYEFYEANRSAFVNLENGGSHNKAALELDSESATGFHEPDSFEEFKNMSPMFVWKNPFNQWMGFIRDRFLNPELCD